MPIRAAKPRATPLASGTGYLPPSYSTTSRSSRLCGLLVQQARLPRVHQEGGARGEGEAQGGHVLGQPEQPVPAEPVQGHSDQGDIWGVRCAAARDMDSPPPTPLTHRYPLACGRQVNLARMSPKKRGAPLRKHCSEYIKCTATLSAARPTPSIRRRTGSRVPRSKMVKERGGVEV